MNAKNGILHFSDGDMEYIRFGSGKGVLVMLPGLGDGLRTMKGTAIPMSVLYRAFAKQYTIYAFSRKNVLRPGCTTRDMARDLNQALTALGILRVSILGVSMGGMIAQHFAADYPEMVEKLVLVVTSARPNPILTESVTEWMELASRGDHTALMDSNLRRIYSEGYYRKNKFLVPVLGKLTKPKSYDRFLVQARACLTHDAHHRLGAISCPTLVVGGGQDQTLGVEASREIAGEIPGAMLRIYPQWGHGLYEEAKDFSSMVLSFLT